MVNYDINLEEVVSLCDKWDDEKLKKILESFSKEEFVTYFMDNIKSDDDSDVDDDSNDYDDDEDDYNYDSGDEDDSSGDDDSDNDLEEEEKKEDTPVFVG